MKTGILAAGLLGSPLVPDSNRERGPSMVDEASMVRAFHADAFVATGGDLTLELVPVQGVQRGAFLLSDAHPSPDAPLNAGTGWMFFRDGTGQGVFVLVTPDLSLRDLEEAFDGIPELNAEFSVAFDAAGAHLVGVIDQQGQDLFDQELVSFRPAPSLSTEATTVFPERGGLFWPEASFAEDAETWQLDPDAQWGSEAGDGLWVPEEDRIELQEASLPPADGWAPFLRLSRPMEGPDGWGLSPAEHPASALRALSMDFGRNWAQRDVDIRFIDHEGAWQTIHAPMVEVAEVLELDLGLYGLELAETSP